MTAWLKHELRKIAETDELHISRDREGVSCENRRTEDTPCGSNHKRGHMDIIHYGEERVPVAIEEVKSQDWVETVYQSDIQNKWDKLYKKPGYDANAL
jgi:hypothetical protein